MHSPGSEVPTGRRFQSSPAGASFPKGETQSTRANDATTGALKGTKDTLETQVDLVLSKMLALPEAQYPIETEHDAKCRELGYSKRYS